MREAFNSSQDALGSKNTAFRLHCWCGRGGHRCPGVLGGIVECTPSDTDVRVAAWVVSPVGAKRVLGLASHGVAQTGGADPETRRLG